MEAVNLKIGSRFLCDFGPTDGSRFEIMDDLGAVFVSQLNNMTEKECAGFMAGIKSVSLTVFDMTHSSASIPVIFMVLEFKGSALGPQEGVLNTRVIPESALEAFLRPAETGGRKNMLSFFALDRRIIKAIRLIGLDQAIMAKLHDAIGAQLGSVYSHQEFKAAAASVQRTLSTDEIARRGLVQRF